MTDEEREYGERRVYRDGRGITADNIVHYERETAQSRVGGTP